jgi:hypothetical protein
MTDNVIPFPKKMFTQEERKEMQRELLIDIALDMSISVFNKLDIFIDCIDIPEEEVSMAFSPENKRDMILIHEAIKSCLYRLHNKDHALHHISDNYVPDIPELKFEVYDDLEE